MAGVSVDGISSLAPELQQAYMRASQAERKPLAVMETRKANIQEKLNLMNEVIGKVDKVKETGDPMELRPMNSADRRIIHQLASDQGLTTESVGEDRQ